MPGPDTSRRALDEALDALLTVLHHRRLPYMVVGGMALAVWGRVRLTQDVDVGLSCDPQGEAALIEALRKAHFLPAAPRAIVGHRLIVCRYLKSSHGLPIQVDLLLARDAYQRQAIRRAQPIPWGRRALRLIAPEDLLLYKLIADRPIDQLDAVSVVEEQAGRLDLTYLRRWAKPLGLTRRLQPLLTRYRHAAGH
ncbi:MAG: hypothetical protein HY600_01820 [Candidatus Omnitrophica bacterium]|nr:hypothetical protein [Candidatus Omnitrophota bacterium]